jgi:hypothetical protein
VVPTPPAATAATATAATAVVTAAAATVVIAAVAAAAATTAATATIAAEAAAFTVAEATATAAASRTAAATATTAAAATATEAAATTTAAAAAGAGFVFRCVDADGPTIEGRAVHGLLCGRTVGSLRVGHKAEATRPARLTVRHDLGFHNNTEAGEGFAQAIVRGIPAQATDKKFLRHFLFCFRINAQPSVRVSTATMLPFLARVNAATTAFLTFGGAAHQVLRRQMA